MRVSFLSVVEVALRARVAVRGLDHAQSCAGLAGILPRRRLALDQPEVTLRARARLVGLLSGDVVSLGARARRAPLVGTGDRPPHTSRRRRR